MSEVEHRRYRAFLSYSHADTREAKRLHRALEHFQIDKDLVGVETPVGPVPKTLRPVFRDREDFAAGGSLGEQTEAALASSPFLIVICSPAAASHYVNEEVRKFKALGRGDRIIPVIVDGAPGDPERECFPPALRFMSPSNCIRRMECHMARRRWPCCPRLSRRKSTRCCPAKMDPDRRARCCLKSSPESAGRDMPSAMTRGSATPSKSPRRSATSPAG